MNTMSKARSLFLGGPLNGQTRDDPGTPRYVYMEALEPSEKSRGGWTVQRKGEETAYYRHAKLSVYVAEGYLPTVEDAEAARESRDTIS